MSTIAAALDFFPVENKENALNAEVILAFVLGVSRSHLYAWPQKKLTDAQERKYKELMQRCAQGEPVPYIIGHQEFWSLNFMVTPDVLVPRPETELLVEVALSFPRKQGLAQENMMVADLGTGSGAIALSIAHERPTWKIHATDISPEALAVAKYNAAHLKMTNVTFHQGFWLQPLANLSFDMIVTNPPYIAEDDEHLWQNGLRFEPIGALASGQDGLDAIKIIIAQARNHLKPGGVLLIEHGYNQSLQVRSLLEQNDYLNIHSICDLAGIERVTIGMTIV